jgi:hypothetical protein
MPGGLRAVQGARCFLQCGQASPTWRRLPYLGAALLFFSGVAGCGGGGGGGSGGSGFTQPPVVNTPSPTPAITATPLPTSATTSISIGTSSSATGSLGPISGGYASSVTLPSASAATTLNMSMSVAPPAGSVGLQNLFRHPRTIGGQNLTSIAYVTVTSAVAVTFDSMPTFTITLPFAASTLGSYTYVAYYDPTATPPQGWVTIEGPGAPAGNALTFSSSSSTQFKAGVTYYFVFFAAATAVPSPTATAGPTGTPSSSPAVTPTPAPTATPSQGATSTPTPTPTPSAPPVFASVTSLAFEAVGVAFEQQFTVSQQGYAGPYALSGINAAVATAQISGSTVTVTPVAAGSTSLIVTGSGGRTVTIPISVTTLSIPVQ